MCCPQWVEQAAGFHSHRACERRAAIKAMDVHVEGNILHQVKEELRSILRVSETIAIHGCVACSQSAACCKRWYSEAGAKEYAMTGCCELCFDDLMDDAGAQVCSRTSLTEEGICIMRLWIHIGKAQKCFVMRQSVAQFLLPFVFVQRAWPRIWKSLADR